MSTDAFHGLDRKPVAFFQFVRGESNLGWVGYCEAISEPMIPAVLHPGREAGARERAVVRPPAVLAVHNGDAYVPYSWLIEELVDGDYRKVAEAMAVSAIKAWNEIRLQEKRSGGKKQK